MHKYLMYTVMGFMGVGGLFLIDYLTPHQQQGLAVRTSAPEYRKPAYVGLPPRTSTMARARTAAATTEVGRQDTDVPGMFVKQFVPASRLSPSITDPKEPKNISSTDDIAESRLDTDASNTTLLESLHAVDLPFEEQAALLASLLPDDPSEDTPEIEMDESLDALSETLSPDEFEAELAASLTTAGVPAAELQDIVASLLPESDAPAEAATASDEPLDAPSETLSPDEFEAELAASLTAAGVPAAELQDVVASLLPESDAPAEAATASDEPLDAPSETLSPDEFEAELAASLTAAGVSMEDLAILIEHLIPYGTVQ